MLCLLAKVVSISTIRMFGHMWIHEVLINSDSALKCVPPQRTEISKLRGLCVDSPFQHCYEESSESHLWGSMDRPRCPCGPATQVTWPHVSGFLPLGHSSWCMKPLWKQKKTSSLELPSLLVPLPTCQEDTTINGSAMYCVLTGQWHGRLARWIKLRACDVAEGKKGWRMNCEIGEATEGLENELWNRWSNGRVGEWAVT